jgi:ComF family protein
MSKNQIYVTKSAFRYEGTIAQLLHRFKFKGDLSAGQLLAQLTAAELTDSLPHRPDVIIPVPLHWRRLILRGFNQSLLFAKTLAPNLNATLIRQGCSRQRHTQSQSVLKGHERTRNVKRCFRVKSNVSDYHVAIVDDIYTTGSTTYALADTLIKAGAANVEILCCARAVLNG